MTTATASQRNVLGLPPALRTVQAAMHGHGPYLRIGAAPAQYTGLFIALFGEGIEMKHNCQEGDA